MSTEFWNTQDAALALSRSLARIDDLEKQKSQYDYSYPPQLSDDIAEESLRVRDAVRFLVSADAD